MDYLKHPLYVQGYTAALRDAIRTISNIQFDMRFHKRRQCPAEYLAILNCMLENRVALRENPMAFIRCKGQERGQYEVYIEGSGPLAARVQQQAKNGRASY